ncbi:GNAT family N-acetyltransferase [uncultured Algibacter sp.]|uniref:GNAT family N-acetyltransferase n=1 Tax=uncultured Algibacter sp. TaxID=298659 RepID=UPI0032171D74
MIDIVLSKTILDFNAIAQLANVIWREHYIPIVGKPQVDYMLEKFQSAIAIESQVKNGFEYFILNFEKKSVGYIAFNKENNALFLSKIYIKHDYRGKKIAKTAIKFAEQKAKLYNLQCIRLTVNINNTNAIKAYKAMGFINNRELIADIGNGFVMDDFEMIKYL